jgi:protein-tyrosine phosphatase
MTIHPVDGRIWRGPRPYHPDDYDSLGQQKINTLLNLEYGWYDWLHDELNFENCLATLHGMIPLHMTLSDIFPPRAIYIDSVLSMLRDPRYGNIYIHCAKGVDRTGVVCAAYRVKVQGWTPDRAIAEMFDMGFHKFPYIYWVPSVEKYLSAA